MKVLLYFTLFVAVFGAPNPPNWNDIIHKRHEKHEKEFAPNTHGLTNLGNESWAYVEVRPNANMFYWLYRTVHPDGHTNRPLIMWLQGGPGGSGVGYGNFEEIGPLNLTLQPRETTWQKQASLLFVDNPVGTGYSYVTSDDAYTTDNFEISTDLVTLMKTFLNTYPEFKTVPFYIYGQSYGGKMAASFAQMLYNEREDGNVEVDIRGFAMGNAWIHPVDSTLSWAPFLFANSLVDEPCYDSIMEAATECAVAAGRGEWTESTNLWRATQRVVNPCTNYVDWYNIMKFNVRSFKGTTDMDNLDVALQYVDELRAPWTLTELMNGPIREKLGIIPPGVTWGGQRRQVFQNQAGDFMRDVTGIISTILTTTPMRAIVYQGQLDLICDNIGAMDFVERLIWPGKDDYENKERTPLVDPETRQTETFVKALGAFKYYWILRSGHSVPKDTPWPAYRFLERVLADTDV